MHHDSEPAFVRKEQIAERLIRRAAELWGVEHPESIDPIVRLMVDAMAFELARLGTEMTHSDGKLLENLAKIIAPSAMTLPIPAHALASAMPLEPKAELNSNSQFFVPIKEKAVNGEETVADFFLSPLQNTPLIKGKVAMLITQNSIIHVEEGENQSRKTISRQPYPGFHGLWLGIDLADEINSLECLEIYVHLPQEALHLAPLLAYLRWTSAGNENLCSSPYQLHGKQLQEASPEFQHFASIVPEQVILADIAHAYRNRLFKLEPANGTSIQVAKTKWPAALEGQFTTQGLESFTKPLLWFSVEFPPAIAVESIEQVYFGINYFPVIAVKHHQFQHRLHQGENIVPLRLPEAGALFYVHEVEDDQGRTIKPRNFNLIGKKEGYYLLHQGELERFDKTTAESHLSNLVRLVQEESSIFVAFGQDLMLKHLTNLRNALEVIRQQIGTISNAIPKVKHYLLVEPFMGSKFLEVDYWTTEQRNFGSYLRPGMQLSPYKQVMVQPGTVRLCSAVVQGRNRLHQDDKLAALRYGMLTRDRIVSKADVVLFIKNALAGLIVDVEVRNGVAISSSPKKGLVRTTDIFLTAAQGSGLSQESWQTMLLGLEESLNQRSVHSVEYRLILGQASPSIVTN
jgi:hypothetical protein